MSRLGLIVMAVVLLVLDAGVSNLLTLGPVRPSLTLPFVVYVALSRGPIEGTLFGLALGFGQDLMGALPLGATCFAYSVVGFACGKLWAQGPLRVFWPWAPFLLLSGMLVEAVSHYLISRGAGIRFLPLFTSAGLPAALYTTGLGVLWFLSPLHRARAS